MYWWSHKTVGTGSCCMSTKAVYQFRNVGYAEIKLPHCVFVCVLRRKGGLKFSNLVSKTLELCNYVNYK